MWIWPMVAAVLAGAPAAEPAIPAGLRCIWDGVGERRMLELWALVSAGKLSAARYQAAIAPAQAECDTRSAWRDPAQAQAAFNYAIERAQLETAAAALQRAGATRAAVTALWEQLTPELRAAAIDETPYAKGDSAFVADMRRSLMRLGGLSDEQLQPALDVLTAYGTIQRDLATFEGRYRPPAPESR